MSAKMLGHPPNSSFSRALPWRHPYAIHSYLGVFCRGPPVRWRRQVSFLSTYGGFFLCFLARFLLLAELILHTTPGHSDSGSLKGVSLFAEATRKSGSASHLPILSSSGDSSFFTEASPPIVADSVAPETSFLHTSSFAESSSPPLSASGRAHVSMDVSSSSEVGVKPRTTTTSHHTSSSSSSHSRRSSVSVSPPFEEVLLERESSKQGSPTDFPVFASSSLSRSYDSRSTSRTELSPALSYLSVSAKSAAAAFGDNHESLSTSSLPPSTSEPTESSSSEVTPPASSEAKVTLLSSFSSSPGNDAPVASSSFDKQHPVGAAASGAWELLKKEVKSGQVWKELQKKKQRKSDSETSAEEGGGTAGKEEESSSGIADGWSRFLGRLKELRRSQQRSGATSSLSPDQQETPSSSSGGREEGYPSSATEPSLPRTQGSQVDDAVNDGDKHEGDYDEGDQGGHGQEDGEVGVTAAAQPKKYGGQKPSRLSPAATAGDHLRDYLSTDLSGSRVGTIAARISAEIQKHAARWTGLRLKFEKNLRNVAKKRGSRGWTSRLRFSLIRNRNGGEDFTGGGGDDSSSPEPLALEKKLSDKERQRFKGVFLIAQFQKHHMMKMDTVRKARSKKVTPLVEEGEGAGLFLVNECVAVKYSDYPSDFPGYDPETQSCRCPDGWVACDAAEAAAQRHQAWEPVLNLPDSGCNKSGGQVMLKNMNFLSCAQHKAFFKYTGPTDPKIRDQQCKRAQFVLCRSKTPVCVTGPWSSWTSCSVPCGEGYRYRWRIPISTDKAAQMNVGAQSTEESSNSEGTVQASGAGGKAEGGGGAEATKGEERGGGAEATKGEDSGEGATGKEGEKNGKEEEKKTEENDERRGEDTPNEKKPSKEQTTGGGTRTGGREGSSKLFASGCAPYHMEERQSCNLGACPQKVVKTRCFWTPVQIERFDLPYDEERGSCKCGSGDSDFDEQEGGGFMVPCTPAEALSSIDLWKDKMRRYCAVSLRVRNKNSPLAVRFHPYGHVVRVGLADRWYVDCTGGWRKFEESEARLFCGRGTKILCRAAKDKAEVPFSMEWTEDEKASGTAPNTVASASQQVSADEVHTASGKSLDSDGSSFYSFFMGGGGWGFHRREGLGDEEVLSSFSLWFSLISGCIAGTVILLLWFAKGTMNFRLLFSTVGFLKKKQLTSEGAGWRREGQSAAACVSTISNSNRNSIHSERGRASKRSGLTSFFLALIGRSLSFFRVMSLSFKRRENYSLDMHVLHQNQTLITSSSFPEGGVPDDIYVSSSSASRPFFSSSSPLLSHSSSPSLFRRYSSSAGGLRTFTAHLFGRARVVLGRLIYFLNRHLGGHDEKKDREKRDKTSSLYERDKRTKRRTRDQWPLNDEEDVDEEEEENIALLSSQHARRRSSLSSEGHLSSSTIKRIRGRKEKPSMKEACRLAHNKKNDDMAHPYNQDADNDSAGDQAICSSPSSLSTSGSESSRRRSLATSSASQSEYQPDLLILDEGVKRRHPSSQQKPASGEGEKKMKKRVVRFVASSVEDEENLSRSLSEREHSNKLKYSSGERRTKTSTSSSDGIPRIPIRRGGENKSCRVGRRDSSPLSATERLLLYPTGFKRKNRSDDYHMSLLKEAAERASATAAFSPGFFEGWSGRDERYGDRNLHGF
ncbi:thrombospondin type 1 domain-containing protein [Cystoisospora suis]|uniref:Thrombospondin type 1 domain-containing protein n=1 Tax=Cystoisospora suis TaxID=483139 RepID=A0A2C6JKL5_9APIC|nr:thrombospondin type 1 domain-containing protein [Cystoisospora suis]